MKNKSVDLGKMVDVFAEGISRILRMSLIRCVGYTDIYIIFSVFREPLFIRGGRMRVRTF